MLGAAPGELTDLVIAAEDLWGSAARSMAGRLGDAESAAEWIRILSEGLRPKSEPNVVQRAIEAIVERRGVADLVWIARQANLSPRQFRRRCLEESGLAPKQLCRVLRFRRAYEVARGPARPDWVAIADGAVV